ncbi:NAD(P)-dependent oxidoreductase [Chitinophaga sp. Cy-1792]|uniref:NAD(P)-dependent oxidoreductase n=1 Tax=Chitinophaga sp. Cy-1792 TaxID=2608339 RepID=UPI0014247B09|nr:NAD(P)H-binding protein [Chitinophaga sp. Cy-1792]NIG56187.1 NAD(P)H-binding protein [Chitinophaga sp. Cy-1792]
MQYSTIAVLGGAGRTGLYLLQSLLQAGYEVKALVRHPGTFTFRHPHLTVIQGDALDYIAIDQLLEGTQAVLSTIGQRPGEPLVAGLLTTHLMKAMPVHQISRYVLLAGINVDVPADNKGPETRKATQWMQQTYPLVSNDRQLSYEMLAASKLAWTMVRVPFIHFKPASGKVSIAVDDCPGNYVNAGDIAQEMTHMLYNSSYIHQAPFLAGKS